jgi:hypothetical protein
MSNTTITTNGNTTVTVVKVGNTTYTTTEIIDISGVIHRPEVELTITKSSTITDVVTQNITVVPTEVENMNKTIIEVTNTTNACYDADKIDPRNTTVNYPYLGLIQLRTIGSNKYNPIIPITTLNGRTNGYGGNLKFDSNALLFSTYDDFKMRRKAEYLKYRGVNNAGFKTNEFSSVVSNQARKTYSSAKLRQIALQNSNLTCNTTVLTPPSNSGIRDPNFAGYYLSPLVQFKNYL